MFPRSIMSPKKISKSLALILGIVFLAAGVTAYLELPVKSHGHGSGNTRLGPILSFADKQNLSFTMASGENRLLLLLNFADFDCPPCYDDFMMFCDLLSEHRAALDEWRVMAIFKPDNVADPADPIRLAMWAKSNGLAFPLAIAPDSLLAEAGVVKSSAVVVDGDGQVVFFERFPMGGEEHRRALGLLGE